MDIETLKYAKEMIAKKGYDEFTASKIFEYIDAHDNMYGRIIDTIDVIDRIAANLDSSIKFDIKDSSEKGGYSPHNREIEINDKDFSEGEYFHEMDHVATSDLSKMPNWEEYDFWNPTDYRIYTGIEIRWRLGKLKI